MTRALSVRDVAEALSVHEKRVRALVHAGKLTAFRVGRALRFEPSEVQRFKVAQEVRPLHVAPSAKPARPVRDLRHLPEAMRYMR